MTKEEIKDIIAKGETFTVEFKGEEKSPLSNSDLYKAVTCLANGSGGLLFIGVEDDRRITGARPRHGSLTDPLRLKAAVFNNTVPNLHVEADFIELEGKTIIIISVPKSERPVGTADGVYARRVIAGDGRPACIPFHFHEMESRRSDFGLFDATAKHVPSIRWEDLDSLEFERLRRVIKQNYGDKTLLDLDNFELAKALGLVEGDREPSYPTLAGVLLLGTEEVLARVLPSHEVFFQVLEERVDYISSAPIKAKVNNRYQLPLLRVLEEVITLFSARNPEEEIMAGFFRVGVPQYSPAGVREAFLNALIHRDYQKSGAVYFQMHEDRIEISNPGGFVEGVTLDNLLVTQPKPRNPRLADAFKRIGLVERTGKGIDTIFEGQVKYGRSLPDYGLTTSSTVAVILRNGPANLGFVRWVIEQEKAGRSFKIDELIILNDLQRGKWIDVKRAENLTQKVESSVREILERLVEDGIIEAKGDERVRTYHFGEKVLKAMGNKSSSVPLRGFEPTEQKELIMQYALTHGSIKRSETAQLCNISVYQATRLLKTMVKEGRLVSSGAGKGVQYKLP